MVSSERSGLDLWESVLFKTGLNYISNKSIFCRKKNNFVTFFCSFFFELLPKFSDDYIGIIISKSVRLYQDFNFTKKDLKPVKNK